MIQRRTNVTVADNSGAQEMVVVHIYGSSKRLTAKVGDIVQCVVKRANPQGTVKDDELVKAVIVRTKKEIRRDDGSYIRFDDNACVVINSVEDPTPKGTRIFGPVARESKDSYPKIVSMATEVW